MLQEYLKRLVLEKPEDPIQFLIKSITENPYAVKGSETANSTSVSDTKQWHEENFLFWSQEAWWVKSLKSLSVYFILNVRDFQWTLRAKSNILQHRLLYSRDTLSLILWIELPTISSNISSAYPSYKISMISWTQRSNPEQENSYQKIYLRMLIHCRSV